jgi:uncharacterized protein (DUF58 family)
MRKLLVNLYFTSRFPLLIAAVVLLFILAFSFPFLLMLAKISFFVLVVVFAADILLLFGRQNGVEASRFMAEKFSNGDNNKVTIRLINYYPYPVSVNVIDEIPLQFQKRDFDIHCLIATGAQEQRSYTLRPVKRGVYQFGALLVYVASPLGLVQRRYRFEQGREFPVYPSYIQMRKYELYAISDRLSEIGIKRTRKIGHNMEFEQIREYVIGDDYRSVNWKATARKNRLMVNQYRDERAQHVYSLIDKGRVMKMPFEGMTLLDYAINASLVISNIAIKKTDKAGLITFSKKVNTILKADNRGGHMQQILEALYNQKTGYLESDYEHLYINIHRQVRQRSLLLLYTNFETLSSMERQLPYLRLIASRHLLVVIFFENTELNQMRDFVPKSLEEVYQKTIAEKFVHEKRQIVQELKRHGIHTILTPPAELTVNTINKYLELKARNLI